MSDSAPMLLYGLPFISKNGTSKQGCGTKACSQRVTS